MDHSEMEAFAKHFVTVVKVLHFVAGVKFLYFLFNLDFDLRLLRREPNLSWPGRVYLANRITCIAGVVCTMVGLNVPSPINCQAWVSATFSFPLLELEFSLMLIVIRVIAIWECSNYITYFTAVVCSVHWGVTLHVLTKIRAFWDPGFAYTGCVIHTPRMPLISMSIATIGTYAVLLIAMLVGLLRNRPERSFGIWKMLTHQGWIWFALAVVAEVPALVLLLMNISNSLNVVLQVPRVVIASIGTTMMFRILQDYHKNRQDALCVNSGGIRCEGGTFSSSLSSQVKPVKIAVHTCTISSGEETLGKMEEGL